ncbi:MAG: DUF4351 domain-containing protein [Thiotrichaceae bacterium]
MFPDVKALFKLLTDNEIISIENIEYASVKQRRADLVARLTNQGLLHLELQSDNDTTMLWREFEYCGLITQRYQQVPLQIVLYVGEATAQFHTEIDSPDLKYRYHLVDIKNVDCTTLLESDSLSDNLLALLGKLHNKADAVHRVMRKITQLPKKKRADTLEKLAILAGLRPAELPPLLHKEANMPISIDLEKNPIFAEIFERYTMLGEQRGIQLGEQRGEITVLRRQLQRRFGELPQWVHARLEHASSQELEQWSLQIFDASSLGNVFKD